MGRETDNLMWLWTTVAISIVLFGGAVGKGYYGNVGVVAAGGVGAAVLVGGIVREMRNRDVQPSI